MKSKEKCKLIVKVIKDDDVDLKILISLLKDVRLVPCPNINLVGHCWVRGNDSTIYTYVIYDGESELAHRASYEIFKGIELKRYGLHHCDVPACINPDHLYDGSNSDNFADVRARNVHFNFKNLRSTKKLSKLWKEYKKELVNKARFNSDINRGIIQVRSKSTTSSPEAIKEASDIVSSLAERLKK